MIASSRARWTAACGAVLAACLLLPTSGASAGTQRRHPAADCGPTIYKANGAPWTCTFADNFSGFKLDKTRWTIVRTAQQGFGAGSVCFTDAHANVAVSLGYLTLTARKERKPFACTRSFSTQYTSGMVTTNGTFAQTYGRFAIRAKFPATSIAGLQSALWMWPQNLAETQLPGEMDIAEEYSVHPDRVVPTLHYNFDPATVDPRTNTNVTTNYFCTIDDVNAFHEYALEWTHSTITVSYDGQVCLTDNVEPSGPSPFDQPYFLLLTQALGVGKNAFKDGVTPLPATTKVDWVRAWK
jgi:beta-glucanase (GH16 family)